MDTGHDVTDAAPKDRLIRLSAICIVVVTTIAALSIGARIVLPVVEALLIWLVANTFGSALKRMPFLEAILSENAARWMAAGLIALVGIIAVYSSAMSVVSMGPQAMQLQSSLDPLVRGLSTMLGAEAGEIMDRVFDAIGLESLMRQVVLGLLGLVNQFGLVAIYVAFLLVDQQFFPAKLRFLIPDPVRHAAVVATLGDLRRQIGAYLWIMTQVSALTAGLSFIAMAIAGLENPFFWAFLIFVLNFIPTIGAVLGALLPSLFALVQFQDVGSAALLCAALAAVQFSIGNILLPRMAGKTLNLSLTVTILCLFLWGALWGVTGMFLAVPLTASLLLIASRFEGSRWIAVALSQTGELFQPAAPHSTTLSSSPDSPSEKDPP